MTEAVREPSPPPLTLRERVALYGLVVGAFALRLGFILGLRKDILFDYPVLDEDQYVQTARAMAHGHALEPVPWFQPPGLDYALSIIFRVAGDGLLAPRVVQAAVSAASCWLIFAVARRFFSNGVAFGAAAICAVHGVLVFESSELLPPTWVVATDLLAVWTLLRAGEKKTASSALGAGAALGLSAVFAPIVLPFALVAAVWLRRRVLVAALACGVFLPIAPVTMANWQRGHEFVLVSTNAGLNFYLGNNAGYDATRALRPGRHWEELTDEPRRAGAPGASAASSYFMKKGLAFYEHDPGSAIGLYARKLYLYLNGVELPRDTDIYAVRTQSPVLGGLLARGPPSLPDGLLIPLALVGVAISRRDWRRLVVPYGFLVAQAVCVAAFFVTSRYRAPALPFCAMFACVGAIGIRDAWRKGSGVARVLPIAGVVALAVLLNLPVREASASYAAELDFYRGIAYLRHLRDPASAVPPFQRAAAQDPDDGRFWFELGNALDAAKRQDDALDAWRHAAAADPKDSRAARRVASVLTARGDLDGAIAVLQTDISAGAREPSSYAQDHLNLALLLARHGDYAQALADLDTSALEDPSYFRKSSGPWLRGALDTPGIDDAGFWIGVGDKVKGALGPDAARAAWRRAQASNPDAAQNEALRDRQEGRP